MSTNVTEAEARRVAESAREAEWKLPSFGKQLFLGEFRLDLIYPQPGLEAETAQKGEDFLQKLRAFLEGEVDPMQIEREAKIPDSVVEGLKRLGAFGMKVSEEYGGLGLSQLHYNRALALADTWHCSLGALLSAHQSIGVAEPLRLFGTEEQKRKWLPLVAQTHVSAFLLTEPDVGSDPARIRATATPTEDGSGYVLDGRKLWATNGAIADLVVVMAKVPADESRRGGITAFVLDYDSDGVSVEHRNSFMGLRGIENSVTRFDDVFIPSENVIGRVGEGLKVALSTLNTGRLSLPAICAAKCKWAAKVAREFAVNRVQWGQAVGKHDAVAQKVAFITASAFGLEAMVDVTSRLAENKANDTRIEAAIAKLYCSEIGWQVIDELVQIRGGRGYETAESLKARGEQAVPVEQALRDMRINRIFEGSTEVMHLLIAREAVDQHLQVAGDILDGNTGVGQKAASAGKAATFYARWLPKLVVGFGGRGSYEEFGRLKEQLVFTQRASRKLARCTFYGMGRWQADLEKKQAFLGRIVDLGAELFAIASAVVYAKTQSLDNPERAEEITDLAEVFCQQARLRTERLFSDLWSGQDERNHSLARKALSNQFAFLEQGFMDPSDAGPIVGEQP
jgi:alkylation response protein AidB-like acyl-CoA dehydrogenase